VAGMAHGAWVVPGRERREGWSFRRVETASRNTSGIRGRSHYSGMEATYLGNEREGAARVKVAGAERLTVSVEEAAEMLGVSRGTAYNLVRTGDIPSVQLGRRIVVPVRRLRALIDGDAGV